MRMREILWTILMLLAVISGFQLRAEARDCNRPAQTISVDFLPHGVFYQFMDSYPKDDSCDVIDVAEDPYRFYRELCAALGVEDSSGIRLVQKTDYNNRWDNIGLLRFPTGWKYTLEDRDPDHLLWKIKEKVVDVCEYHKWKFIVRLIFRCTGYDVEWVYPKGIKR